jgi:ribose transport system permease protein
MKRILGILVLLIVVYLATWVMSDLVTGRGSFMSPGNQENLLRRTALFGIIGIGVAFVIITGGIDLSVGSVICLVGVGFPWLVSQGALPVPVCLLLVFAVVLFVGLSHGVLVTWMNLQPFVVTLCGLLMYRGITRGFTGDQPVGFGNELKGLRWLATGEIPVTSTFGFPVPCLIFVLVAVLAGIFLNRTVAGRHLLALGNNEEAARFSGVRTKRLTILAYVLSSLLAGLGGLLFVFDTNSAQPVDFGNFYELFAIAAAVLGGCSLRGGSGTILGVVIGTALIQLLRNMINLVDWIPKNIEFAVIGGVILAGAIGDEIAKRIVNRRRGAAAREG